MFLYKLHFWILNIFSYTYNLVLDHRKNNEFIKVSVNQPIDMLNPHLHYMLLRGLFDIGLSGQSS